MRTVKRTSIIFLFAFLIWAWHTSFYRSVPNNPDWHVQQIAAHSRSEYSLPVNLLEQLLHIPQGSLLSEIDIHALQEQLSASPVIQSARIWKIFPSTIGVEYTLRMPIATLGGNIGIDASGATFPLSPFYPPLRLPTIILSPDTKEVHIEFIPSLEKLSIPYKLHVTTLDLSKAQHKSYFRREVVITFSSPSNNTIYVRLNPRTQNLKSLQKIFSSLSLKRSGTIDLRYPNCAIVSEELGSCL